MSNKLLCYLSRSLFSYNLSLSLNSLSLFCSRLFSNYLNSSSLSLLLTALFFAALVAAAHCSKCNSYDKKHFLHNSKNFLA